MQDKSSDVFNPFIHGSNSRTLILMKRTEFKLMSPIDMITNYGIAPLAGEIEGGGYQNHYSRCNPCFSTLNRQTAGAYPIETIIRTYTQSDHNDFKEAPKRKTNSIESAKEAARSDLSYHISLGEERLFSNINIILIYATQYQQLGGNLNDIPGMQDLQEKINTVSDFLYLYLLLGRHITANTALYQSLDVSLQEKLRRYVSEHFTATKIMKHRRNHPNLDLKDIYERPTEENLEKVVEFLSVPDKTRMHYESASTEVNQWSSFSAHDKRLFKINHLETATPRSDLTAPFLSGYVLQNSGMGESHLLFEGLLSGKYYTQSHFMDIEPAIKTAIEMLTHRSQVIASLGMSSSTRKLDLSETEHPSIFEPFPVIFLCHNQEPMIDQRGEYRANRPLQLGIDITMLATDTMENAKKLHQYLLDNHLEQIEIVLFSQLEQSSLTLLKPSAFSMDDIVNVSMNSAAEEPIHSEGFSEPLMITSVTQAEPILQSPRPDYKISEFKRLIECFTAEVIIINNMTFKTNDHGQQVVINRKYLNLAGKITTLSSVLNAKIDSLSDTELSSEEVLGVLQSCLDDIALSKQDGVFQEHHTCMRSTPVLRTLVAALDVLHNFLNALIQKIIKIRNADTTPMYPSGTAFYAAMFQPAKTPTMYRVEQFENDFQRCVHEVSNK